MPDHQAEFLADLRALMAKRISKLIGLVVLVGDVAASAAAVRWLGIGVDMMVALNTGFLLAAVPLLWVFGGMYNAIADRRDEARSQLTVEQDIDASMVSVNAYRMMLRAGVDMATRDMLAVEEHDDSAPAAGNLGRKLDAFRRSMETLETMDRSMWDGFKSGVVPSGYRHRLTSAYVEMPLGNSSRGWVSGQELDAIAAAEGYIAILGTFLDELHAEQRGA